MKKSKTVLSLLTAVILAISICASSFTSYAAVYKKSYNCAGYSISCSLTKQETLGSARTVAPVKTDSIYVSISGYMVDSKGEKVAIKNNSDIKDDGKSSQTNLVTIAVSGTGVRFLSIVSFHASIINGKEAGISLQVS